MMTHCRIFVGIVPLVMMFAPSIQAQSESESFDEKLRKAAEMHAQRNRDDDEAAKRTAALVALKREAMEQQRLAESQRNDAAFQQRIAITRLEDAARLQTLESKIHISEQKLSRSIDEAKATLAAIEAVSGKRFHAKAEQFREEIKAKIASELAKAEAERERKKEMAKQAVLAYFTGGASLAMAAGTTKSEPTAPPIASPIAPPKASTRVPAKPSPVIGKKVYDAPIGPEPAGVMNGGRHEKWMGKLGGYIGSAAGSILGGYAGKGKGGQFAASVASGVGGDVGTAAGEWMGRKVDEHAEHLKKTYRPEDDQRFDPRSLFRD